MLTRTLARTSFLAGLLGASVSAAQPADAPAPNEPPLPFRHGTLTAEDANGASHDYAYAVWRSPALGDDGPAPAILFLHGYGECGTDGEKPLHVGLPPQLVAHPERWPFVVLIPQKPVYNSEWEDHDAAVTAMMAREFAAENVDPDRVAVTGLSQGGHGTIALGTAHADRFCAVAPVCGYIDRWNNDGEKVRHGTLPDSAALAATVSALRDHPVWIFHGGRDDVVMPAESRLLHESLRDAGSKTVRLTIFPEDNHNSWDSAYGDSGLATWLVEHTGEGDG